MIRAFSSCNGLVNLTLAFVIFLFIISSSMSILYASVVTVSSLHQLQGSSSESQNEDPIEVSTVRTIDYREAAVAAALAIIVSIMRVFTSANAITVGSKSTYFFLCLSVLVTLSFAALSVLLPIFIEEQSRYAWQWFHAVCPIVLLLPLAIVTFSGSKRSIPQHHDQPNTAWNLTMSLLFDQISITGKILFVLIWVAWIVLAVYLQAYDSIVFYFAAVLALEVGLTIPVAIRKNEQSVLEAAYGNGCELQLGVFNSQTYGRLVRLTRTGIVKDAFPVDVSSFRLETVSPLEHRLPFLSSQQGVPVGVDFGAQIDLEEFKVVLRSKYADAESFEWVGLLIPAIHDPNLSIDERHHQPLLSIAEVENSGTNYGTFVEDQLLLHLPEHVCGIFCAIAQSFMPMANMTHALTWDSAMVLGKALSAQRMIGLDTGGYFGTYDENVSLQRPHIPLPLCTRLERPGCIDYELGMFSPSPRNSFSSEQSFDRDALRQGVDAFSDADVDLCSGTAAWKWLKQEYERTDGSFSLFFSVWSTIDCVNELYTIVEQQDRWRRMWLASRTAIRVRNKQRLPTKPDGVHRLVQRVLHVASQSGPADLLDGSSDTFFVIPTAAMALLVLVIAANGVFLRQMLQSHDEEDIERWRSSENGSKLLRRIGNLLWLSTFALPLNAKVEREASEIRLAVEDESDVVGLDEYQTVLRGLRLDMEAYNASDGASFMNVYITALAHALRDGARKDDVHLGQSLYDTVVNDIDTVQLCGKAGSSQLGKLSPSTWESEVDSHHGATRRAIRVLLLRRLALVGLSTCGALAALSLLSALV